MDIDDVDFSILKVLRDADHPMWKKKIHRELTENEGGIPRVRDISVQTIGRRVDDLHDRGHLESCIVSPSEINRDLIIAFKVTEQGERTADTKREELLREYAFRSGIFGPRGEEPSVDTATLAELMVPELGLDPAVEETLQEQGATELQTLLATHYLREGIRSQVTEDHIDGLAELAEAEGTIADLLLDDIVEQGLRDRL